MTRTFNEILAMVVGSKEITDIKCQRNVRNETLEKQHKIQGRYFQVGCTH